MKPQVGKYFFGRHRRLWGIWMWGQVTETVHRNLCKGRLQLRDALREVYRLNGWENRKTLPANSNNHT